MNENLKYSLYLNVVPVTGSTTEGAFTGNTTGATGIIFKIKGKDGKILDYPEDDFYLNIPLYRSYKLDEYADVQKQEGIETVERQNFNLYFIEYSFFDTVKRNKIFDGTQLNTLQINYIRKVRTDLPSATDIPSWFNSIGISQLPWFKGTTQEVTIDMIDIAGKTNLSIISKASVYPIDINS